MLSPLGERLRIARHQSFVGRQKECYLFQSILAEGVPSRSVLYIWGPSGVGKTTLLWEWSFICQHHAIPAYYLDVRHVESNPQAFLSALALVLTAEPIPFLSACEQRTVLLIDTWEALIALDFWMWQEFLPQLSQEVLVVFAGSRAPSIAWRMDPGWQHLLQVIPLRYLNSHECIHYLQKRGVPAYQHEAIFSMSYGHPLALSLFAENFAQGNELDPSLVLPQNIIKPLLMRFLNQVEDEGQRVALEACAIVRQTTQSLLQQMLGDHYDTLQLFEWLRDLSFMEPGQHGIFPHDLVRDVLIQDLRWRHPDGYANLHEKARNYYTHHLEHQQSLEQQEILHDYIFLHRDNPAIRSRFSWQPAPGLRSTPLIEADLPILLENVRRIEGSASADLAAFWFDQQPQGVTVFRNLENQVQGFMLVLALHTLEQDVLARDPATLSIWECLQQQAPLRLQEGATLLRFWLSTETYQDVSAVQSQIFIQFIYYHRKTSGLAYTFIPCADPQMWTPFFAYADFLRLPQADFQVGDRVYAVFGHDWRIVSPETWQALLAQRELTTRSFTATTAAEPQLFVLSETEFFKAVQEALRDYTQPDRLRLNPLLQSRVVVERVEKAEDLGERVGILQSLIRETLTTFQKSPRRNKLYRAIMQTYIQPAATQEQAAEYLDLPFSTYRRHLKAGIGQIAASLWQLEIE